MPMKNAIALSLLLLATLPAPAGVVETLDHRTCEGTVRFGEGGRLSVQPSRGVAQQFALDQVRVARFRTAPEKGTLPPGWQVELIGQVEGKATEKDGVFELQSSGGDLKNLQQHQAVQFAYRLLRAEGEMVARVLGVNGAVPGAAGIMMRENLETAGGYALLAVTPDLRLRFDTRPRGWGNLNQQDLGKITLPVWLRLVRRDKESRVAACKSADGVHWQEVGKSELACRVEPFPEGANAWLPKQIVGLAVTGPGTNATASARFDHVTLTARALLGEYFADGNYRAFRFARPDAKLEFNWGLGAPAPEIPDDHFSVRWTGQIEPKFTETYRFYVEADNEAWLWVDGQELPNVAFDKKKYTGRELPLKAGQKYSIKLHFQEGAGVASVRLGWSSRSQPLEVIAASQLSYTYQHSSPTEEADQTITNVAFAPGLWLRKGSFLAGRVRFADGTNLHLKFAGQEKFEIPSLTAARVIWRAPRRALSFDPAEHRTGVFLRTGDFLDSELTTLDEHSLQVRSVLFGQRSFSLDGGEVVALVLQPQLSASAPWTVRLLNGSILQANALRPAGEALVVEDTSLGQVVIPERELLEIRRSLSDSSRIR